GDAMAGPGALCGRGPRPQPRFRRDGGARSQRRPLREHAARGPAGAAADPGGPGHRSRRPGGVAPAVTSAVRQAGRWLEEAGYVVEEIEPPELGAVADLWAVIGMDDTIAALEPVVAQHGDAPIKQALRLWRAVFPARDPRGILEGLAQRDRLLRLWELLLEERPLVVTPVSNEPAFPVGLDLIDAETTGRIIRAQMMQLAVPVLGLP